MEIVMVGLGVMGGSLARDLSQLAGGESSSRVVGVTLDPDEGEAAVESGAVASWHSPDDIAPALSRADLVIYAVPLGAAVDLLEAHAPAFASDAVVTDVTSLMGPLLEKARSLGLQDRYVGGHPMAGSAESGFGASREGLYRDARVWLAEGSGDDRCRERVAALWSGVGARPAWIEAEEHDRAMAWVSHLPQLVSNALATTLARRGISPGELGPGARDATRLAGSSPAMWRDLLAESAEEDALALRDVADVLGELAEALEGGREEEVLRVMEESRGWREGGG